MTLLFNFPTQLWLIIHETRVPRKGPVLSVPAVPGQAMCESDGCGGCHSIQRRRRLEFSDALCETHDGLAARIPFYQG